MLTLKRIEIFLSIIKNDFNYSKTAKVLNTVQPNITREMIIFEESLGFPVFKRSGKKIIGLNNLGSTIRNEAINIIVHYEKILSVSENHKKLQQKEINIGTTHTQACHFFPQVIKDFKSKFPDTQISIHQHDHEKLNQMIRTTTIDFGFYSSITKNKEPDINCTPCYQWQPVVIFHHNHPFCQKKTLFLKDIAEYPIATYSDGLIVRELLSKTSETLNTNLNLMLCTNNTTAIKEYVKKDICIGIVNNISLTEEDQKTIGYKKLEDLKPLITANLISLKGRKHPEHIEAMIKTIKALSTSFKPLGH